MHLSSRGAIEPRQPVREEVVAVEDLFGQINRHVEIMVRGLEADGRIRGLEVVYLYFQIPLMVLVFLPAVDGIKPQWREATESLGGNSWHYWRYVAGPLLFPSFLALTPTLKVC